MKTFDQTVIERVKRDLRSLVELFALSDCVERIQDGDTIASFATIACSGNGKCEHCVCVCGLIRRKNIQCFECATEPLQNFCEIRGNQMFSHGLFIRRVIHVFHSQHDSK